VTHRSFVLASLFVFPRMNGVASAQSAPDPATSSGTQTSATVQTNQYDGFFHDWFSRVTETQSEQPIWITPLATTTPRLGEEYRFDFQRQIHNSGVETFNYGGTKGLEIIPAKRFEVNLGIPAYVVNNPDSPKNGFGDWQFLVKYRIAARNAEHGNYILHDLSQATLGPVYQPRRDGFSGKVVHRETL
jgi:hypothetical protein